MRYSASEQANIRPATRIVGVVVATDATGAEHRWWWPEQNADKLIACLESARFRHLVARLVSSEFAGKGNLKLGY